MNVDVVIVGGGTGGCAAAIALGESGLRVLMTEPTDWIGGQFTSQGVPADEHPWIETEGCTQTYREFRESLRQFSWDFGGVKNGVKNPGNGWVSRICVEPRIAWQCLCQKIPKNTEIWLETAPVSAEVHNDEILAVQFSNGITVEAAMFLDATELGDLLELTGAEFVTGAESRSETEEDHAHPVGDPDDWQGFTWCFAMGHDPNHVEIHSEPEEYGYWSNYVPKLQPPWPGKLLDWTVGDVRTLQSKQFSLFGEWGMFRYRQIIASENQNEPCPNVTVVNWAQNDCLLNPLKDTDALEKSRQLSKSTFHWLALQEPGLFMAGGPMGTADGFAKAPYFRESRRIRALTTILEQHVTQHHVFQDSVGVGAYRIDLHPSTNGQNSIDVSCFPFEIPLGSLVPVRLKNLIPACKNIGSTHITNGCYRLHPVEWTIGEAAGHLAAWCIATKRAVQEVTHDEIQPILTSHGFQLFWPDEIKKTPL